MRYRIKILMSVMLSTFTCGIAYGAEPSRLRVSDNGRYLVSENGKPFFYLGDTAWELFHRLNREEADLYLTDRAGKGFTVIQAVALAELDGLNTANPYGHRPLVENDPARPWVKAGPHNDYWDHVDYIVDKAAELGMFIGMLPTWGDKWNKKWGIGPVVFNSDNAEAFGRFLGERYKDEPIIWILGGDRNVDTDEHRSIIERTAKGLAAGDGGVHLMTFALFYIPTGKPTEVRLDWSSSDKVRAYWFNPRQNCSQLVGEFQSTPTRLFTPPSTGRNYDWVLVLDAADQQLGRLGSSYQHLTPQVAECVLVRVVG